MKVAYSQLTLEDRHFDSHIQKFREVGAELFFIKKNSGASASDLSELTKCLKFILSGDTLIIESLNDLGSNNDIIMMIELLKERNVKLVITKLPITLQIGDNLLLDNITKELIVQLLPSLEKLKNLEIKTRQKKGIIEAKKRGIYKGRPLLYTSTSKDPQKRLIYNGVISMLKNGYPITMIADVNGITRQTVYRIKNTLSINEIQ